jgi:hypothetical protein
MVQIYGPGQPYVYAWFILANPVPVCRRYPSAAAFDASEVEAMFWSKVISICICW